MDTDAGGGGVEDDAGGGVSVVGDAGAGGHGDVDVTGTREDGSDSVGG